MKTDVQDYTRILADLKKRLNGLELSRKKLLTAISAIQDILDEANNGNVETDQEIGSTRYSRMTVLLGTEDLWHLGGRKPMKTRAICDGLTRGGISSKAEKFWNSVHATLSRSEEWESKNGYWSMVNSN